MLSVCDRTVVRKTHHLALILTKDKGIADEFGAEVHMTDEERRDIASLAEVVCQQYALAGQHMPAALLVTHLAFYGARVAMTMSQLKRISDFNAKRSHRPSEPAPDRQEKAA